MERTGFGTGQLNEDPADDMDMMDNQTDDIQAQRAEIEETRCEMAGTLDAIKEKLDPGMLMDQAKEKVTDTANTVLQHAKETVHEATTDAVHQVKEIPHAAMDATKRAVGGAVDSAKETMRPAVEAAGRMGGNVVDTVKSNPIPYALIGIGLGWLYLSSRRSETFETRRYRGVEGHYYDASSGGGQTYGTGQTYGPGRTYGTGSQGYEGDAYHTDPYQGRPPSEQEGRMGRMTDQMRETLGSAKDTMKDAAGNVRDAAGNVVHRVQETAGSMAGRVQETAGNVASQVRHGASQAADTFQSTLDSNPLAVGAAALGLGLVMGLLLPETQREKQMMGEARNRVGEKVQQTATELGQKVQTVARETMDAAKDAAKDAAQNEGLTNAA